MSFKLQKDFIRRIPLILRKRDSSIYFQNQHEIARTDGLCAGYYMEYDKIMLNQTDYNIGIITLNKLKRFEEVSDLTLKEFYDITQLQYEQYEQQNKIDFLKVMDSKDIKDVRNSFVKCNIEYSLLSNIYEFGLIWTNKKGRQQYTDFSPSTGELGVLTFKESLEFDIDVDPEVLGKMVLEAFDRSQQLEEICSSGFQPPKVVELNSEDGNRKVSVNPPKDPHFYNEEDGGVGEIYQVYTYYAHEGDEPSAYFALGIAPYIFNDFTPEVIKKAWEGYDGKAEYFDHKQISLGIFTRRAEMRNKKVHRISYYIQFEDKEILECEYCLYLPNRRKKLDEKLSSLFEKYALECKLVNN